MIEFLEFIQSKLGCAIGFLISFGFGAMAGYYGAFRLKNEELKFKNEEIKLKNDEIKSLRKEMKENEDRFRKQIAQMEINAAAKEFVL